MGAILRQWQEDSCLHPVAFMFKSFNEAQQCYDTYNKELSAIVEALQQWWYLLKGTEETITIYSDHCNLQYWSKARIMD